MPQMTNKEQIIFLRDALKEHNRLFEKLDEAMASPDRISRDTAMVGGFVSYLDITETAEEIVNRAIAILKIKS